MVTRKGTLTTPRKTILEIVSLSSDHPSAADVIDRLKARGCCFAYATVYNSLRFLTQEGLLREVKLEGAASRYDARVEEHQHIICTSCGKVGEVFVGPPIEWLNRIAAETGYRIDKQEFLFKGVCPACRTAQIVEE
ncbi:MAG: transcriptional repressor [Gorillibacterium sp.]|nr:transcriptional repressor [Gorillibacterium sp.]